MQPLPRHTLAYITLKVNEENKKIKEQEEIKKYLNDLDNLIDCGFFINKDISDYTFYHKGRTLRDFIQIGREYIRQSITSDNLK